MAKHKYQIDEQKVRRFLKEGRGQGEGSSYKPWLTVQDVPSEGRTHRPFGWKTQRVHHLLSDIEYRTYLLLNWAVDVVDIREQFPLDRERTVAIARQGDIDHPVAPGGTAPLVMTTDFLVVSRTEGTRVLTAYAAKAESDLSDLRVIEKLEIERRYWSAQQVRFVIVTDTSLPMPLVSNLDWLYSAWDLSDIVEPHENHHRDLAHRFLASLATAERDAALHDHCDSFDRRIDTEPGTALLICKHLLAHRRLCTDLAQPRVWKRPVSSFHESQHALADQSDPARAFEHASAVGE